MKGAQLLDGRCGDQRRVTPQDDHSGVPRPCIASDHEGGTGSTLLGLQNEIDSRMGQSISHAVGLVSDDGVDMLWRHYFGCGSDYMRQQRLAPYFVQYFGVFGFEPRAFAGGHNGNGSPG